MTNSTVANAPTTDYREHVSMGLLYDVLRVLDDAGIRWADDDGRRRSDALVALCELADAVAGPPPAAPESVCESYVRRARMYIELDRLEREMGISSTL